MVNKLIDLVSKKLAANFPFCVIQAHAPNTADKYSRAYNEFHYWTSRYDELVSLPASDFTALFYLEYLLQNSSPYSRLEYAFYGINWIDNIFVSSPCA